MIQHAVKIFFAGMIAVLISGCAGRNCKNVVCPAGQQCLDGGCYCNNGYEGADCNTLSYLKYVGNYNVSETCMNSTPQFLNYTCFVTNSPNVVNVIYINNLFNMGITAVAEIYTDGATQQGTYILVRQQSQGGIQFDGTGNFDVQNNRMVINFNYTFNFGTYQCTHTFFKQP